MSAPSPAAGRLPGSPEDYERRLRGAMRLMSSGPRDAVAREIRAGLDAQVKAAGGDFGRVAPTLDDPRWVGAQMVKVYGVAPWVKALAVAAAALLALVTVPGVVSQPAEGVGALAVALVAFGALIYVLFWAGARLGVVAASLCAAAACALRALIFMAPRGGPSPLEVATPGEVLLFAIATALLAVVALAPAIAARLKARADDA